MPGARRADPLPGSSVGLESEHAVFEDGRQVDFRRLIAGLRPRGARRERRLGWRLESGHLLTCDGWYAEVACPPEPVGSGGLLPLPVSLAQGQRQLVEALDRTRGPYTVEGYSTHFNVDARAGDGLDAAATELALAFGPALMFLTAVPGSRGVLIRPRPGRLELAGEYVGEPERIRATAAILFAACHAVLSGGDAPPRLTPGALAPADLRRGWRLEPATVSAELEQHGRDARLATERDGTVALGELLRATSDALLPVLRGRVPDADVALAVEYLDGTRRVPLSGAAHAGGVLPPGGDGEAPGAREFAAALRPRDALGWRLRPAFSAWELVVYDARAGCRSGYVAVPRSLLGDYGRGALDDAIASALQELGAAERPLRSVAQAAQLGAFTSFHGAALSRELEHQPATAAGRAWPKKRRRRRRGCEVKVEPDGTIRVCVPVTLDPQQSLKPQEPAQGSTAIALGVWAHSGAFAHRHVDHHVRSRGFDFAFVRQYRSSTVYPGVVGQCWDHCYNVRVVPDPPPRDPDSDDDADAEDEDEGVQCTEFKRDAAGQLSGFSPALTYHHGTGRVTRHPFVKAAIRRVEWCRDDRPGETFTFTALVSTYAQNPGEDFEIEQYAVLAGSTAEAIKCLNDPIWYRIRFRGGTRFILNCHGYLVQIRDRHHNRMCFRYRGPDNPATLYSTLDEVVDTQGRLYRLRYKPGPDGVPRVERLTDPFGRAVSYEYDDSLQLMTVDVAKPVASDPDDTRHRPRVKYAYRGRAGLLHQVTAPVEVAAGGPSYLEIDFDGDERVKAQRVGAPAGSGERSGGTYSLAYPSATEVVLTDRARVPWTYKLRPLHDTLVVEDVTVTDEVYEAGQIVAARQLVTHHEFDDHFHLTLVRSPSGRAERFAYRPGNAAVMGGSELDDVDGRIAHFSDLARDDLLEQRVEPAGGGTAFVTTYAYERLFNSREQIVSPDGTTKFEYDNGRCSAPERNGNPITITYPRQATPDGSTRSPIETFEYTRGGFPRLFRDADGVEHTYTRSADGQVHEHLIGGRLHERFDHDARGNLETYVDQRGSTWKYGPYDRRDNLLRMVDPLAHAIDFRYDLNDRLKTKTRQLVDDVPQWPGWRPEPARELVEESRYDILGKRTRLIQRSTPFLPGAAAARERTTEWHYDGEERLELTLTPRAVAGERTDARSRLEHNARGQVKAATSGDVSGLTPVPARANPGITRTYYDVDGRPALVVDPVGKEHRVGYDAYGRVATQTWPNGTVVTSEYEKTRLRREWVSGPLDTGPPSLGGATIANVVLRDTRFELDALHRVIRRTEKVFIPEKRTGALGGYDAEVKTWYTPGGRVEKVADPAGRLTVNTYALTKRGELEKVTLPGGHTVEYLEYSGWDPRVTVTTHNADPPLPRPGSSSLPDRPDPIRTTEVRTYDALGRVVGLVDVHGTETRFAFDSLGNPRGHDGPLGREVDRYDGFGRRVEQMIENVAAPSNPRKTMRLEFGYDVNDNRIEATNRLTGTELRRTAWEYDGRDMPFAIDPPAEEAGEPIRLDRRPDGRVQEMSGRPGRSTLYEYDDARQLRRVLTRDGPKRVDQRFGYDGLARVTWAVDSNGGPDRDRVQVFRAVDSLGRAVRERTVIPELGFDRTMSFRFEADNRRRTVVYPYANPEITHRAGDDGNVKEILADGVPFLRRSHQGPGRVLESSRAIVVNEKRPAQQTTEVDLRQVRAYDPVGRLASRRLLLADRLVAPQTGTYLSLAAVERLTYGAHGMIRTRESGATFADDDGGRVKSTFSYDGAARLRGTVDELDFQSQERTYDWDAFNRLRGIDRTDKSQDAVTKKEELRTLYRPAFRTRTDELGGDSVVWGFDEVGRVKQSSGFTSQAIGIGYGTERRFQYDAADRLTSVRVQLSSVNKPEPRYLYDGFGRLAARLGGRAGDSLADPEDEIFLYDGRRCVLEYAAQDSQLRRYVYDELGQVVDYEYFDRTAGLRRRVHPLMAIDGAPWLLLQGEIDVDELPARPQPTAGTVTRLQWYLKRLPLFVEQHVSRPLEVPRVVRYEYASAGPKATAIAASALPLGDGGRRTFGPERLLYNVRRFYDPDLRGFITQDPLGQWADTRNVGNPYASSGNNPVTFGDDGGLAFLALGPAAMAIVGAAAAGAAVGGAYYALSADHFNWTDFAGAVAIGGLAGIAAEVTFGLAVIGLGGTVSGVGQAAGVAGVRLAAARALSGGAAGALAGGVEGGMQSYGASGGDWDLTVADAASDALSGAMFGVVASALPGPLQAGLMAAPLVERVAGSLRGRAEAPGEEAPLPLSIPVANGVLPRASRAAAYVHNAKHDTGLIMAGEQIVSLKLPRQRFRASVKQNVAIAADEHRRHGIPSSWMKHMIYAALIGAEDPVRILASVGCDPRAFSPRWLTRWYGVDTLETRVFAAARKWHRNMHNVEANLWAGPAAENVAFGRFIARHGRDISHYHPKVFDVKGLLHRPEWKGWVP